MQRTDEVSTNTSGVSLTCRTSLLISFSLASVWREAEADLLEPFGALPGDRERDLERLPRRLEGELEMEPLFLCLKDFKG